MYRVIVNLRRMVCESPFSNTISMKTVNSGMRGDEMVSTSIGQLVILNEETAGRFEEILSKRKLDPKKFD